MYYIGERERGGERERERKRGRERETKKEEGEKKQARCPPEIKIEITSAMWRQDCGEWRHSEEPCQDRHSWRYVPRVTFQWMRPGDSVRWMQETMGSCLVTRTRNETVTNAIPRFYKPTKCNNGNTQLKQITKHTSYQVPTATCFGIKVPSSGRFSAKIMFGPKNLCCCIFLGGFLVFKNIVLYI